MSGVVPPANAGVFGDAGHGASTLVDALADGRRPIGFARGSTSARSSHSEPWTRVPPRASDPARPSSRGSIPYDGLPPAPGVEFALRHDTDVIGTGTILAVAPGESDHDHMPADWQPVASGRHRARRHGRGRSRPVIKTNRMRREGN